MTYPGTTTTGPVGPTPSERERRGREALNALERLDDRQLQEVLGWLAYSVPERVMDACRGVRHRA